MTNEYFTYIFLLLSALQTQEPGMRISKTSKR